MTGILEIDESIYPLDLILVCYIVTYEIQFMYLSLSLIVCFQIELGGEEGSNLRTNS